MAPQKSLTIIDIIKELDIGKVTTKFLLKRFSKWLPCDIINGQALYPVETVTKLFMIHESLASGMLPNEIEIKLDSSSFDLEKYSDSFDKTDPNNDAPINATQASDINLDMNGLKFLQPFLSKIEEQQKRIAAAHEKRAAVEERKAMAMEKRAEAEEQKAKAMVEIAGALQKLNLLQSITPDTITPDISNTAQQSPDSQDPDGIVSNKADEKIHSEPILYDKLDNDKPDHDKLDDLSLLLDDTKTDDEQMDDLSMLIDDNILSSPQQNQTSPDQIDDLSLLLDKNYQEDYQDKNLQKDSQTHHPSKTDDLYALIDENEMSELSPDEDNSTELDDLTKLIDEPQYDVSILDQDLDDLSLLVEQDLFPDMENQPDSTIPMDDLSQLIDDQTDNGKEAVPAIKIDISPEEDKEKYKAAVMKIIIGLEADGLDIEATTDLLNKNKIKTLSGKLGWKKKAISQIYKFIRSAK